MWRTFQRVFLLAILALTGLAAVITGAAIITGGSAAAAAGASPREQEVMTWAIKCVAGVGFLQVISFAALSALQRERWRFVALPGMLLAAVMMLALPLYVWWEVASAPLPPPGVAGVAVHLRHLQAERLVQTGLILSGVLCLVPFVMVPRMRRVGRILQWTAVLYLCGASLVTLGELWNRTGTGHLAQAVATLLIPAGVCMMGVFVLQRFLSIPPPAPLERQSVEDAVQLTCPRCGKPQSLPAGETARCADCRLKIKVEVEEPACPNCGFNLHRLTRPTCPECGFALDTQDVAQAS
jgi:predicted RNA-binding Zn-ribbon protein involved in translation (DUF1610 family)